MALLTLRIYRQDRVIIIYLRISLAFGLGGREIPSIGTSLDRVFYTITPASATTKRTIIDIDDHKEQPTPFKKGKGSNKPKSPAIILVDVLANNKEDKDDKEDDKEEDVVIDNN
ncbi:hypothetical protein ACRALDRAFT_1070452 [Sodiomyces alcalophilus JCM 7366]|uniref:uncharacterized protein n=1 Tax=Sodiomyces alcalophilus JCM 7366 TaxID=591952 RepID=UPI0039B43594